MWAIGIPLRAFLLAVWRRHRVGPPFAGREPVDQRNSRSICRIFFKGETMPHALLRFLYSSLLRVRTAWNIVPPPSEETNVSTMTRCIAPRHGLR